MKLNFKISIICLILFASSINSLDNDDNNSGEDESHNRASKNASVNSIDDQLNRISVELIQSKEREDLLKLEVKKTNELLDYLQWEVATIKREVNDAPTFYAQELHQVSKGINELKRLNKALRAEINAINEALKKNETLEKSGIIPFIDFHKCKKSVNIENDEPTFTWIITDMKKKINQTRNEIIVNSKLFSLKGYSMKALAAIGYSYGGLWCLLTCRPTDSDESSEDVIDLKLFPSVTFVFKNQSQLGHYNDVRVRENYPGFIDTLKNGTVNHVAFLIPSTYDVSDTVVIDFYVETPEQAEQRCSDDATLKWALHDVSKKREMEEAGKMMFHMSPYFYSGPKGYRMVSVVNLNFYDGLLRTKGLKATVGVINGPYDSGLSKSVHIEATFTFLHPTNSTKNIVRSAVTRVSPQIIELDIRAHVTNEELETVLVKDTLYYHVATKFL